MEDEELNENEKIKKLQREVYILRFQNNRLLAYLRFNKSFYRQKLEDSKIYIETLQEEVRASRAEKIIRSRDENISN